MEIREPSGADTVIGARIVFIPGQGFGLDELLCFADDRLARAWAAEDAAFHGRSACIGYAVFPFTMLAQTVEAKVENAKFNEGLVPDSLPEGLYDDEEDPDA